MIGFILFAILGGAVIGGLARFLVPGPDPMGFWATVALGILGQVVAGLVFRVLFNAYAGFVAALLVTMGLVLVSRRTGIGRRRVLR